MELSTQDKAIQSKALSYAKENRKAIAKGLTNPDIFPSESQPVSVFMAGSPGAGKTEASIALIEAVATVEQQIVRIDPDELRSYFEDYDGLNSHLFQKGVSVLVEKIHDFVLKQKQSFLLDGTLSHYEIAKKNIARSLGKNRMVQILYVYQEPLQAWQFVLARESTEGRKIQPAHFIEQYFKARAVVNHLKLEFGKKLSVDLLLKNIDGSNQVYKANVDSIDSHIPERYTLEQIAQMLNFSPDH